MTVWALSKGQFMKHFKNVSFVSIAAPNIDILGEQ